MNLVKRFESWEYSNPRKTHECAPSPIIVSTDAAIVWSSLALITMGYCIHRMGPAFKRSRFGTPLALLGLTCLFLLPSGMEGPESDLHHSAVELIIWLAPFVLGVMLILRAAPTYWKSRPLEMALGWVSIAISWYLIAANFDSVSASEAILGIWASLGLIVGIIAFASGVVLAERYSRFSSESEPLSNEEELLVRTIIERRLGGETGGD